MESPQQHGAGTWEPHLHLRYKAACVNTSYLEEKHMAERLEPWGPLAALLLGVACGGPPPPPEEPTPTLRVEVGTGRTGQFTPVAEGDTLRLQRGCQGSQHVFVSLRAWGLAPDKALVTLALRRTGDSQVVSLPYRLRLPFTSPSPTSPAELTGLLLVVPEPAEALGRAVALEASVEDEAGHSASDRRAGTLQWGPDACP